VATDINADTAAPKVKSRRRMNGMIPPGGNPAQKQGSPSP
jgi:hypothetical protein